MTEVIFRQKTPGNTITAKYHHEKKRLVLDQRLLGYPIDMAVTPELLDFLREVVNAPGNG